MLLFLIFSQGNEINHCFSYCIYAGKYKFNESEPVIPRWITDPIVLNGLRRMLDDMRKILQKNPGKVDVPYLDFSKADAD